MSRRLDELAREHTESAVTVLAEAMNDPFAETRDRIRAAAEILDRGHGKAVTATIALPANRAQARILAGMSDDDLMAIVNRPLPRLAQARVMLDPIDATYSEVPAAQAVDSLLT